MSDSTAIADAIVNLLNGTDWGQAISAARAELAYEDLPSASTTFVLVIPDDLTDELISNASTSHDQAVAVIVQRHVSEETDLTQTDPLRGLVDAIGGALLAQGLYAAGGVWACTGLTRGRVEECLYTKNQYLGYCLSTWKWM
jgi:hypothetical protein